MHKHTGPAVTPKIREEFEQAELTAAEFTEQKPLGASQPRSRGQPAVWYGEKRLQLLSRKGDKKCVKVAGGKKEKTSG